MNIAVTLCGQWGHIIPTLPLAVALRDRGHHVRYAFVDHPPLNKLVSDHGFSKIPLSMTRSAEDEIMQSGTHSVLAMSDAEREERALATWFAPLAEQLIDDLVDLAGSADMIIFENTTLAAPLAAAITGIPAVLHGTGASSCGAIRYAAAVMEPLWFRKDMEPRPLSGLMGDIHLDIFPSSIPNPAAALSNVNQPLRPEPPLIVDTALTMPDELSGLPLVLVTLGTNFNKDNAVWAAILGSLADLPIAVVAATGPGHDLAAVLGGFPANTVAGQFLPLGPLLESASVVITHGGAGTTLAALSLGKPLLLLPQGADQHYIAHCVVRASAGDLLRPDDAASQVMAILEGGRTRRGAERIRSEIGAMPHAGSVAGLLESLPDQDRKGEGDGRHR